MLFTSAGIRWQTDAENIREEKEKGKYGIHSVSVNKSPKTRKIIKEVLIRNLAWDFKTKPCVRCYKKLCKWGSLN